jgi:mannose-6-phosphate isomerase
MRGGALSERVGPFRLKPVMVERVWGSHDLKPWYPVTSEKAIGEAWLSGDDCVVETGPLAGKTLYEAMGGKFPLLVKILFPQDKLSVQVHPDDAHAARLGGGTEAKTECWYILQAEPGATVALGLKPGITAENVKSGIEDGTLEQMVESVPVSAGDMVYVSAGTIHAIWPGVVILEIQQNSDTTYRLFDYGRPRELHLDKGLEVLKPETDAGKVTAKAVAGAMELISVPHFTVLKYELKSEVREFAANGAECLIALKGDGFVECDGEDVALKAGEAVVIPAGVAMYSVQGTVELVRCFV